MNTQNLKTKIFRSKIPGTEGVPVLVIDHQFFTNMEAVIFAPIVYNNDCKARFLAEKDSFLELHEFDKDLTSQLRSKIPLSEEEIKNVNVVAITLDIDDMGAHKTANDQPMQFRPRNQDEGKA
jgi:hypothetical protein